MNETATPARGTSAWRSPWVIGWIALVVVVVAVNVTMITLALTTGPGLVVEDFYEHGQDMERTIATRLAAAPNWTMRIDMPADSTAGAETTVRLFVVDRAGQPVQGEAASFRAFRPSDANLDFAVPMTAEAPGRYVAKVVFPVGGVWDSLVTLRSGEAEGAETRRISVALP